MNTNYWKCPVCGAALVPLPEEKRFVCRGAGPKTHSFDIARQGYVNLLLPQQKGASDPGDSKMMVRSRTSFLEKGYYLPFSDRLNEICARLCAESGGQSGTGAPLIADAGCGEGYYTNRLAAALPDCDVRGFDLAREAVAHGASAARARALDNVSFGVASLFGMPLRDASAAGTVCLFAPVAEAEFARILAPGGFLVLGVPGEDHLFGLKAAVYEKPYKNPLRRDALPLFDFVRAERVAYDITLGSTEDIVNLFRMTPYYWKTSEADAEKLQALSSLRTEVCFDLLVYKKK